MNVIHTSIDWYYMKALNHDVTCLLLIIDYCHESLLSLVHNTLYHLIKIMLGSMQHQKLSLFYHLPTRGRAGIKLGDADTSPTYL